MQSPLHHAYLQFLHSIYFWTDNKFKSMNLQANTQKVSFLSPSINFQIPLWQSCYL